MGSLATDFIWKGFADEYADKDVDLIPSTERMIEAKFKRLYTIFRLGHFASRIVELDNKFELPTNSILHIADNFAHPNSLDDLPDVNNNIFIQREHFLRYIYHDTELNLNGPCTYEDKYIYRIAGLPSKLMKFKSTYRGMFKYIATMDALPRKKEALLIINHNPLFRVKMFGRLQFFRRMELILTSILNNCCKLAEFGKNQFIFLPWDTDFFDKSKFLRSRTELNYASVKYPESFHYIVMMHLLNFLWDTATTSIFSKLPDEVLTQLYIVPYLDGKYIFYNLSVLKNLNVKNMAYRRVCNQLNLLSLTGLEETEKHPAYHDLVKETITDAKEDPEHQSSITNLKDAPVSKIITTVQDEPDTPTNAEHKADIVERALTTINNGVRQVINKVVHPVPAVSHGIAETVKAKPAEHKVTPVSTDIVSPLNPVTAVKKNGEVTKRIAKVTKEANVTKIDTNLADTDNFAEDYIEDFDKDVDTYIDNYDMSPAAKNHFKRVAKAYKNLTIGGETIEELLENNSDSSLSDTTLDEKQLGYLPDKSALKSTLDTFEKDYIKKTFKKQLAGIVTSFAKEGAYLTGLKENKVVTDLHNYTEYKCQYTDIRGNKSTVSFKIPNVHSNGTVTIDGVTQIIKKQRCPLPIVKISDTVVSLASNFNKTRVVRNTNKAHSFFTYINNFVNDKTKSNAIVTYGNNKLNLPISYEYTVIGERYNNVQFTDIDSGTKYLFNFNYEERGQYFGKSADLLKELESEYGVYVGYNDNDYFFVDNNNTVFAVKKSGGEDVEYPLHSLIDIFKLSVFKEQRSKIKPLSEWITIRLLDLNMPVIFMLAYRYGLRNTLDYLGIHYTITEARSKVITGENVTAGTESFDVKASLARVQYLNELNKSGIDKNKIIIGASAALVAYGLLDTPNKDLDISIEDNYKKTLINKGVLVRNTEDGATHWVVSNTHIDAGVDGPDQQKFSYTELKKLGITIINGYTFISLEGMIKFYEKCKELFPNDKEKQQKYNDRIALIEQALASTAGTEDYKDDIVLATESYSRPVLARLGDVTIYATDNGNSTAFGTKTLAIRAIIITVKLGTKASCSRRIANFDGSHFQMANDGGVPRDVVDRLSQYLHCGKRKISKANLTMVSADKPLDPKVVNTPRLSPSEYSKLVTKLNIPGNKVMPPQPGNEALSEEVKYVPQPNDIHIRFADRVLHFNRYPLQKSLIVAGLANYDLTSYSMSEFEGKDVYFRILADEGTSTNYLKGIDDFYDLFIDNITYSVLKMMKEPTNVRDLLIRCAVLLSTTDHLPPSSGLNHRIRGYEQFAAILCNEMSRSFANFRSHKGLGNKFTINPDAVYLRIIQNATMLPAELGSPMEDMKLKAEVSYAGIGGRTAESFVVNDRRFDESDTGVIGEATVDNGKAGMAATLSYNPNIKGTLGIVQPTEDKNKIEPSQLWTTTALVFPCSTNDDTKRINFINIQSSHLVPVKQYDRLRVRTGYERIVAHRCSRIFAGVAEEDGKVTKIDDKAKLVEVTYKSGRKDVFTFGESYTEFQSFEVTNRVALDVKMGQSFKKGDIITHNTDYFHKDHDTGQVDFSIGSLANVALMESDATTEDSCEISERLSKKLTMYPTNERVVVLSAKSLVHYCAKVGDHVIPTDNLMIFEESPMTQSMFTADDDTLSMIADLNKATPHANHQGEIVKIDAYYGCEINDMSPTLQPIVKAAVDEKIRRSKLASETDKADEYPTSSIIAKDSKYKGTMFTEDTVMLIFHIKEAIPHGTGDKLVLCNQLKCTCCGVFPKKLYTESGVEVDMLFSARAMNKRIVLSAPLTGIASRILERVEDDICKEWFGEERPPQGSEKKE